MNDATAALETRPQTSLVTQQEMLNELCQHWHSCDVLAVDTEFDRQTTFYARLALIQVFDGEQIALIDPLAIADLSVLDAIFSDSSVCKVFHSCSEDLEVLSQSFAKPIANIFDTQIGAAMAGMGSSVGFANLVAQLLGVELGKGETRTDWLQRPLTDAQLGYAADDVLYLLPMYHRVIAELDSEAVSRVKLDCQSQIEFQNLAVDPTRAYLEVKGINKLRDDALRRAYKLALWREQTARAQNKPRSFVIKDVALVRAARLNRLSNSDLLDLDLRHVQIRKHGEQIVRLHNLHSEDPTPEPVYNLNDVDDGKAILKKLQQSAGELAQDLGIAPEVLFSRKTLEYAILEQKGMGQVRPRLYNGWRESLLAPLAATACTSTESVA